MPPKLSKKIKKLTDAVKECGISTSSEEINVPPGMVIMKDLDQALLSRWPKVKLKVPNIFLHKPVDFGLHVRKLLSIGIHFYQPYLSRYYTKITCPSFNDHKALIQYFENKQLPYHTFGHPSKRKLKVVIRGIPKNINLEELKKEFKSVSIPVIRMHRMHKGEKKRDTSLILAVVPHNDEGKKLLKVKKVLSYDVKMEPPDNKLKQCHRCQMWGHTQRYCHGQVKCVKCAGSHLSKKCDRDASKEPPKCANCGSAHTANFKECPCCPESVEHQTSQLLKKRILCTKSKLTPPVLITMENCDSLYKNIVDKTSKFDTLGVVIF